MLGFGPLGTFPLAAITTSASGPTTPLLSIRPQLYWRVRSTIRLIRPGTGLHQAAIQRRVSLYGIRRRGTVALIPPPPPGTAELPSRQLQEALQRFAQTYHVWKKPWRPPRRSKRHVMGIVASSPTRVSWIGLEVVSSGNPSARTSWIGVEVLRTTTSGPTVAQVSWMGVEVLRSVGNYAFPALPMRRRRLQTFSFKRKAPPRPRRLGHPPLAADSGFVYLICA